VSIFVNIIGWKYFVC